MSIPIGSNLAVGAVLDGITAAGFLSVDADGVIQNPGEFGTVGTAYLTDSAVTTAKLANLAVTSGKLADDAVTAAKLADNAVDTAALLARAVTYAKIQAVAQNRILGRVSTGSGDIEEMTVAQLESLLYASKTPQVDQANSFSALQTVAAAIGMRFTPGAAPGSPATGQVWYNTTKGCLEFYNGTANRPLLEYGTWTPALTFATPGDISVAYSTQVGRYWKIGRLLFIEFQVTTSTWTYTTASGAFNVNGLPYTVSTAGGPSGSILMSSYAGIIAGSSNSAMYLQGSPNTTSLLLRRQTPGASAAASVVTTYQVSSFASGTQVTVAGIGLVGAVNES